MGLLSLMLEDWNSVLRVFNSSVRYTWEWFRGREKMSVHWWFGLAWNSPLNPPHHTYPETTTCDNAPITFEYTELELGGFENSHKVYAPKINVFFM